MMSAISEFLLLQHSWAVLPGKAKELLPRLSKIPLCEGGRGFPKGNKPGDVNRLLQEKAGLSL